MDRIYITRDFIHGLKISTMTVYRWMAEGMPTIRQNPYHFNVSALEWIRKNKPKHAKNIVNMES